MRATTALHILITLLSVPTPGLTRQTSTSYCKCICFQNSTIIPLNSPPQQRPKPPPFSPSPPPTPSSSEPPPPESQPSDNNNGQSSSSTSNPRQASTPNLPRHPLDSYDTQLRNDVFHHRRDGEGDSNEGGDGTGDDGSGNEDSGKKHHRTLTCSDCNRAFCLDYHLPMCKGAKEEDVFTSCFQRDSVKDETVVLVFILLTASLLSWAVLKPFVDRIRASGPLAATAAAYAPVALSGGHNAGGGGGTRPRGGRGGNILPRTEHPYRDGDSDIDIRRSAQDRDDAGSIARQGGLNS